MSKLRISSVALTAVLSIVFATACGGGDETPAGGDTNAAAGTTPPAPAATPGDTPPPVPEGPAPVIAKGDDISMPEDIPAFPDAKPAASMLIPGKGGLVTFTTDSAVADIVTFYKGALPDNGWKIDNVSEAELRTRITASKEGRQADVVAARNGDATEILISIREGA